MIQVYIYRTVLDGKDGDTVKTAVEAKIANLMKVKKPLLGTEVHARGESLWLALRIEANDRWRISREARRIMSFLLASQRLPIPGGPEEVQTPATARTLTADQGRVPRARRT